MMYHEIDRTTALLIRNDVIRSRKIKVSGNLFTGDMVYTEGRIWTVHSCDDESLFLLNVDDCLWGVARINEVSDPLVRHPVSDLKVGTLAESIYHHRNEIFTLDLSCNSEYGPSESFYRLYYQSFKVYRIQGYTVDIYTLIQDIAKRCDTTISQMYEEVAHNGMGRFFSESDNAMWNERTLPLFEAYFHSRMHLNNLVYCVNNIDECSSSGSLSYPYASVLCLFGVR